MGGYRGTLLPAHNDTLGEVRFLITVARARREPIVSEIINAFRADDIILAP